MILDSYRDTICLDADDGLHVPEYAVVQFLFRYRPLGMCYEPRCQYLRVVDISRCS